MRCVKPLTFGVCCGSRYGDGPVGAAPPNAHGLECTPPETAQAARIRPTAFLRCPLRSCSNSGVVSVGVHDVLSQFAVGHAFEIWRLVRRRSIGSATNRGSHSEGVRRQVRIRAALLEVAHRFCELVAEPLLLKFPIRGSVRTVELR